MVLIALTSSNVSMPRADLLVPAAAAPGAAAAAFDSTTSWLGRAFLDGGPSTTDALIVFDLPDAPDHGLPMASLLGALAKRCSRSKLGLGEGEGEGGEYVWPVSMCCSRMKNEL